METGSTQRTMVDSEMAEHRIIEGRVAVMGPVLAHRIVDDLAEIIAECELLLPSLTPVYTISKRVRNIRRLAGQLAQDIAPDPSS